MRWTEDQVRELLERRNQAVEKRGAPSSPLSVAEKKTLPKRRRNKTEAEYELLLEARKRSGEIHDYGFERMTLRLGDECIYRPDFDLVRLDNTIEIHEVKGHMRDDARVKLQTAARMYPHMQFWILRKRKVKDGGGFIRERVWP